MDAPSSPDMVEEAKALHSAQEAETTDATTRAQAIKDLRNGVERFRHYTKVENPPTSQSDALALLSSHWIIGEDPATYRYEARLTVPKQKEPLLPRCKQDIVSTLTWPPLWKHRLTLFPGDRRECWSWITTAQAHCL